MEIIEKIVDSNTGNESFVTIEIDADEIALRKKFAKDIEEISTQNAAKIEARNEILLKLGITEEEAKLLLS